MKKVEESSRLLIFFGYYALEMKFESLLLHKLGVRHGLTLEKLAANDGVPIKELQGKYLNPVHLTYVLERLSEIGFVKRRHSKKDRRLITVHLTEKGRQFIDENLNQKQETGNQNHEAAIPETKKGFWIF